MSYGKFFLVILMLLLAGLVYFLGVGGDAVTILDWFFSSADAFFSALSRFIKWLIP